MKTQMILNTHSPEELVLDAFHTKMVRHILSGGQVKFFIEGVGTSQVVLRIAFPPSK